MKARSWIIIWVLLVPASVAQAGTIYKCVDGNGVATYQEVQCATEEAQVARRAYRPTEDDAAVTWSSQADTRSTYRDDDYEVSSEPFADQSSSRNAPRGGSDEDMRRLRNRQESLAATKGSHQVDAMRRADLRNEIAQRQSALGIQQAETTRPRTQAPAPTRSSAERAAEEPLRIRAVSTPTGTKFIDQRGVRHQARPVPGTNLTRVNTPNGQVRCKTDDFGNTRCN
jgi:hypothetical protein